MPDLLLELFCEEIPARMQAQAAKDLERLVVGALSDRGLMFEGAKAFAGPRRLTLAIAGLPATQPDVREEIKGPKVDAPQGAIDGFLKKTGLTIDQLQIKDLAKGKVYIGVIEREGRPIPDVLAEILPETFAKFPWPKSMRWPQSSHDIVGFRDSAKFSDGSGFKASAVRWVRPLHGIVCTFDGEIVAFEFAGVTSGNTTSGHRFLSKGPIEVRHFADYEKKLRDAHVILDVAERKEIILHDARQHAFALGLELIEDGGLLEEVAGLAEWPVVLVGRIEDRFMDVPPEILQTSMRTHQKYFSLRDPKTGHMANRFAVVSNMIAADGGVEIVAGNERVLRARLSDAKFFWDRDRKTKLADRVKDLKDIVYYEEYSYWLKVDAIAMKSALLADKIGANREQAKKASLLSKADLTSGVVGEFPELQGIMGRYYALHDGESPIVADAIRDHYKPLGPSDSLPKDDVGAAVALADKFSTLYWLFHEGERPTGSKDPYALRRAALGIIRIILEKRYRLSLKWLFDLGWYSSLSGSNENKRTKTSRDLIEFIADRLKIALREKGTRHDLIDAVFSLGNEDDLVRLVARVEALQSFLKTDEGANLLAGYKRAANILKAEEKKDAMSYDCDPDPDALMVPEEKALFVELATASEMIRAEVERERFVEAMGVMARLRAPVDAFFEHVKVNDDDPTIRANRLKLLSRLRATLHLVADFSKIEG